MVMKLLGSKICRQCLRCVSNTVRGSFRKSSRFLATRTVGRRKFTSYTYENLNEQEKEKTNDGNSGSSTESKNSSFTPGYVEGPTLPWYLSHFDAIESFCEWSKWQWFSNQEFRQNPKKYIHAISSYVVPYYHFHASARSQYKATRKDEDLGDRNVDGTSSCSYPSNLAGMQVVASKGILNDDEIKFLTVPLGETQFQRMQHKLTDVLPVNVTDKDAETKVMEYLKKAENDRMNQFAQQSGFLNPSFATHFEYNSRTAYMPCYIIHYSPSQPNPDSEPLRTNNWPESKGLERAIIDGSCGNIMGKKHYSLPIMASYSTVISLAVGLPLGTLLYHPFQTSLTASLAVGIGAALSGSAWTSAGSNKYLRLEGDLQNTSRTQFQRQAMIDKEVEELLYSAENAWGTYEHRSKASKGFKTQRDIRRQQTADMFRKGMGLDPDNEDAKGWDFEGPRDYERADFWSDTSNDGEDGKHSRRRLNVVKFSELYEVLGVSTRATTKDIQNAFTEKAKKYHPDVINNDKSIGEAQKQEMSEKFQKILVAFTVLRDPQRRQRYDETGSIKTNINQQRPGSSTAKGPFTRSTDAQPPRT